MNSGGNVLNRLYVRMLKINTGSKFIKKKLRRICVKQKLSNTRKKIEKKCVTVIINAIKNP